MPRFILIDPWLEDVGGHNFQYALDVLQSAEELGYEPILVVNRALRDSTRLAAWQVLHVFRFGMCSHYWLGPDGRRPQAFDLDGKGLAVGGAATSLVSRARDVLANYDRKRRILDLAAGCREMWDRLRPTNDDVMFLPSMSEADFIGVVRFLRDEPRSAAMTWHLQFHFNIFSGRDTEFAEQNETLERIQRHFHAALDQIPDHPLRFYATTDPMARQFDRIGVGKFKVLPYPVRDLGASDKSTPITPSGGQPLRVAFAGGMRREKGRKQFGTLIAAVWQDCLSPGKMQLAFQAKPRQVAGWLPRHLRRNIRVAPMEAPGHSAHLLTVRHPLDTAAYHAFIRQTDIGLFLYNSRRYFARASGILVEMLAAGIPVIVPAGCWLSDQLALSMYEHVQALCESEWSIESLVSSIASDSAVSFAVPSGASDLTVQFPCPANIEAGRFFQIDVEFEGNDLEQSKHQQRAIVGPRSTAAARETPSSSGELNRPPIGALFPIPPRANAARIQVGWAFHNGNSPLTTVQIAALKPPATHGHHPRSRVGLIASAEEAVPDLLREMHEHYQHYRRTAEEFSQVWRAEHHPRRTVEILSAEQEVRPGHSALTAAM